MTSEGLHRPSKRRIVSFGQHNLQNASLRDRCDAETESAACELPHLRSQCGGFCFCLTKRMSHVLDDLERDARFL